ncbi:HFX_2341 family transcriptional regulator domain-containing protein [Geoglobus sp.]
MQVVHVIAVGMNRDRIMESLKMSGYPIQKAYLTLPKTSEYEAIAEELEKALSVLVEIEKIIVDESDVYRSAIEILRALKKEKDAGNQIYINATDAPRTLMISCYIAAQLVNGKMYVALPKYEKGKEVGVEKIVEIPVPPLKKIGEDKLKILKAIYLNGKEVDSINSLIKLIEGKLEKQKAYMAQRAKMSYHLKGLEKDGLIETRRDGKNVKIMLTPLGEAFCTIN